MSDKPKVDEAVSDSQKQELRNKEFAAVTPEFNPVRVVLHDPDTDESEEQRKAREATELARAEIETGKVTYLNMFGFEAPHDGLARAAARYDPTNPEVTPLEFWERIDSTDFTGEFGFL